MSKALFKSFQPVLGIALSLTLTACPTPNTSEVNTPIEPQTPEQLEVQPETSDGTEPPAEAKATSQLKFMIKGDASLLDFSVVQETQGICVDDIHSLKTTVVLPDAPNANLRATLKTMGAEINGNTITLMSPVANLRELIAGIGLELDNLPEGQTTGSVDLNHQSGNSMGSLGFAYTHQAGSQTIDILLKPVGDESNPKGCIPLIPEVDGADLTATAGGLLVEIPSDPLTSSTGSGTEGSGDDNSTLPNGLAGIRLDVDNRFITALGETRQLSAILLDASGNPLPQDGVVIEWASNRPQDLSIDVNGRIEALVGLGYAQVTVKVSGTEFSDAVLFDITDPSFFSSSGGSGGGSFKKKIEPEVVDKGIATEPAGMEFQINTFTSNFQTIPSIAMDAEGNFVVVWASMGSYGTDTSSVSIQGQRYDSSGGTLGSQFQVNTYTTSIQHAPSVAMDAQGNFVIIWESMGSYGTDTSSESIQGQRYDSTGATLGSQFQVNSITTSIQTSSSVAMDADGDFVVVWQSYFSSVSTDTDYYSIQGQRYDSTGEAVDSQFQVNTYSTDGQTKASVAMDADGDFVVVWQSKGSYGTDNSGFSIQGQRYDSSGGTLGSQFQVNTYTTSTQSNPSVAMDTDGAFVVVWQSNGSSGTDTSNDSIQGQRYDSSGGTLGSQFQVNTYTTSTQSNPSVAMDADGDFVMIWESNGSSDTDTSNDSIQGQRYDSTGSHFLGEFVVNAYTTNSQRFSSVAIDEDGDFAVVWQSKGSYGTDTSNYSIQGQRYN